LAWIPNTVAKQETEEETCLDLYLDHVANDLEALLF
jgi:hypothetical protein